MFLRFSVARMIAAGLIGFGIVDQNVSAFQNRKNVLTSTPRLVTTRRNRHFNRRQDEAAPFEEKLSKSTIVANIMSTVLDQEMMNITSDVLNQEMAPPKDEPLGTELVTKTSEKASASPTNRSNHYGPRAPYGEVASALAEPGRLVDLAVSASRPRKAKVSFHSTLSAVAAGCYLAASVPILSPGSYTNGMPRFYDQMLFDNVPLARMTLFLFAAVGVTGVFRLPRRTPRLRRLLFEQGAWNCVLCWATGDSNYFIATENVCTFDLMQTLPLFAYLFVTVGALANCGEVIVETISGPLKGRDSIIFGSSPVLEVFVQAIVSLLFTFVFPMALFYRDDIGLYDTVYAPGIAAARGVLLSANLVVSGFLGFGMLIATLLFEKRITREQAQILFVLNLFISGLYDSLVSIVTPDVFEMRGEGQLEQYIAMNDLVTKGYNEYHAAEFVLALAAASIIVGLWKRSLKELDAE